jgi:catechol 2,3-dioxygenase-like lactoylglutathione lyase family enzyme
MHSYVEHVQYVVSDLEAAIRFYSTVFGWTVRGRGHEQAQDRSYEWVHIGTDTSYMAFRTPYDGEPFTEGIRGYKGNHIGIVTDSPEEVLSRLKDFGCTIRTATGHPYRLRYYARDFDDNEIEIIHYLSDRMSERNDYAIGAQPSQRAGDHKATTPAR